VNCPSTGGSTASIGNERLRLVIITPVRDEEATLEPFITSVLQQDFQTDRWLLINDNSSDSSAHIIEEYVSRHSHLELLHYPQQGQRTTGHRVIRIIEHGLEYLESRNIGWDVLLKLDADIQLDRDDFFITIMNEFAADPELGIASGTSYYQDGDRKNVESTYLWHTYGTNKFYRRECFEKMGGLKPMKGWDGFDDILARHHGYMTRMYPELTARHFYLTQTRRVEGGVFAGLRREVLGYRNRSYPIIMYLFKSMKLVFRKPYCIGGLYFFVYGLYLNITTEPTLSKREKKIVRKFLLDRFLGKLRV